jgi:hypothetical protein
LRTRLIYIADCNDATATENLHDAADVILTDHAHADHANT